MRKWLLILVALFVFGFSLLAHMPAQLVIPERYDNYQFLGVGGTLWRGEVQQVLFSGKALPIRNLNWKVRPVALLTGTLEADFHEKQTTANRGNMRLNLLSRQLELKALHWRLPDGSLDPWFRAGVSLQGQFVLDLQNLQLAENTLLPSRLQGRVDWQNAELQIDVYRWTIGSPVLQFSDEGEAIRGMLRNSQPMLPGEISFECTASICLADINLQPAAEAPQSLMNGLLLLGLEQTGDTFSGQVTIPLKRSLK
jgi:hypothetical protein